MNNSQLINQDSGNFEYFTPRNIIIASSKLMNGIDLDPACSARAYEYQNKHSKYYFVHSGLTNKWFGNVWLNHPFSKSENKLWIDKLISSYEDYDVISACCITYASTSEKWFAPLLEYPQFYFTGRVNYIDGNTLLSAKGVTKGSVLTFLFNRMKDDGLTARLRLQEIMNEFGYKGIAKY